MASPFPYADILEAATPANRSPLIGCGFDYLDLPADGKEYQQTAESWKYVLSEKARIRISELCFGLISNS